MSKEDKIKEMRSFLLFYLHGITMPPDMVDSIYESHILNDTVERIIKSDEFMQWFEDFENMVEYIDYTRNPFGIYKNIRHHAHSIGKYYSKDGELMDMSIVQRFDDSEYTPTAEDRLNLETFNRNIGHYVPDDPDIYEIIVVDHARLLTIERGFEERSNLENFSASYLMPSRDRWSFILALVQQQAASSESVENLKNDRLRPSAEGLGIAKNLQQDCDTLFGLFSPARHNKTVWEGYDVGKLKDSYRELEVIFNRRGNSVRTHLYFNGASNFFKELPQAANMTEEVYEKVRTHDVSPNYS